MQMLDEINNSNLQFVEEWHKHFSGLVNYEEAQLK